MDLAKVPTTKWKLTMPCCRGPDDVEEKSQQRPQHMSGSPDYPGKAKPRKKNSYTWALPEEDESPLYRYGCCWPCRVSSGTSLEGKISTNGSNQEDKDHALALPPPYQTGSVSTLHELSVQRCPLIRPGQPPHPH